MEMLKKSKRVSWAPDEYLCEVKPVLETDSPFRTGTIPSLYGPSPSLFASSFAKYAKVYGDIWKEKKSKKLQSHDEENPVIPPGFENRSPLNCLDTKNEHYNPIVPTEEVKDEDDSELEKPVSTSTPCANHVVVAYVAAITEILKLKNQGASIDTDFLVKILSNPQMIGKLSDADGVVSSSSESALANAVTAAEPAPISTMPDNLTNNAPSAAASSPMFVAKPVTEPVLKQEIAPMSAHRNLPIPNPVSSSNPVPVSTQQNCFTTLQPTFRSMPAQPGPFPVSPNAAMTTNATPTKDAKYYHNLIKEYGGNKQEMPNSSIMQPDNNRNQFQNMQQVNKLKHAASKTKSQKRCRFYFGSATGCLNGSKCIYRHDILPELQAGGTLESTRAKKKLRTQ